MELIIVLVIGVPIVLAIWLIVRAVSAENRIEELTRRLSKLEFEVSRLKKDAPSAPAAASGTAPAAPVTSQPATAQN